jgi:subtilisin family serine protease
MKNKKYIIEKKLLVPLLLLFNMAISVGQNSNAKEHYFYYKGEKFDLDFDYSSISVTSTGEMSENKISTSSVDSGFSIKNQNKSYTTQNITVLDKSSNDVERFNSEIEFSKKLDPDEYFANIQKIQEEDGIIKASPVFTVRNQKIGLSNNFYVKLKTASDYDSLVEMANKYSIEILGYNKFMPLWYTLSCTKQTAYNALNLSNIFYESNLFDCSEPEFLYHDLAATNDPYYQYQWGLNNTGQDDGTSGIDIKAEEAWSITTGSSNVKVAVFDHGFEMDHPDLQNNVYGTGYDATTATSPAWVRGNHGTACAGIIGAQQNNSIGISGVAPSTNLMSISINLFYSDTPQQLANGFSWAWQNGADVISNSWGGYTPSSIIEDAIQNALTYGRNGKGMVVVFAAGNEDDTIVRYPGRSIPEIIVAGAASPCGERKNPGSCDGESWWGSCYGSALDVVAPGVLIPTTDRQGTSGYESGDYTLTFNGTSSACPHVAGLAALILSRDTTLTGAQVRNIIESTAQKVGSYTYQTTSGRLNGSWNDEMGYGLIDAYAAVMAVCPTVSYTSRTVTSNTTVTGCNIIIQDVNVQNGAKLTVNADKNVTINGAFEVQLGSSLDVQ